MFIIYAIIQAVLLICVLPNNLFGDEAADITFLENLRKTPGFIHKWVVHKDYQLLGFGDTPNEAKLSAFGTFSVSHRDFDLVWVSIDSNDLPVFRTRYRHSLL